MSFDVTIIKDNVLEDNETFYLTIVNSLSNQGFVLATGMYENIVVIIVDTTSK